jgi:adenosine deaminase
MAFIESNPEKGRLRRLDETNWLNIILGVSIPLAVIVYFFFGVYINQVFFLSTLSTSICAIISITFLWKTPVEVSKNEPQTNPVLILALYLLLLLFSAFLLYGLERSSLSASEREAAVSRYFEKIRKDESQLAQFMLMMPKGGDLHHHYSGSVYAETYWEYLMSADCWINEKTLQVDSAYKQLAGDWSRCSKLQKEKKLADIKQRMLQQWSVKDYYDALAPSDKLFFDAFGKFSIPAAATTKQGLLELKKRAKEENLSYIETMPTSPDTVVKLKDQDLFTAKLISLNQQSDTAGIVQELKMIYDEYKIHGIFKATETYLRKTAAVHYGLQIDDSLFTMRYLTSTNRTLPPVECYRKLLLAFDAAARDTLIVGVNILSPEDNEISLRDFNLHIAMFKFCKSIYPNVKVSMHAGELRSGLVRPEDLRFHISSSVTLAMADRIGHGVDIAYEHNSEATLDSMKRRKVAVEINLSSNEFILKVKGDAHPIMYYKSHGVPIVISTDDAGILRTDLTMQFLLLAKRYPKLSYSDIKQFVMNSISYGFLKNPETSRRIQSDLSGRFAVFENKMLKQQIKN